MTTMTADATVTAAVSAEIEAITDQIRRALECPICLLLVANMSCFCPNGHAVCDICLDQLWNRSVERNCPMCRSPMAATVDVSATAVKLAEAMMLVKVACAHRPYGCTELLPVNEVIGHESVCVHVPDVRCLVTACQWVGIYEQLFDHVRRVHPHVGIQSSKNRLTVYDADTITSNRRRTYLFRSPDGMFWVLLSRETRSRIRTGVFVVTRRTDGLRSPSEGPAAASAPAAVDTSLRSQSPMTYRVTWSDSEGRSRTRSRFRRVDSSASLGDDIRGITNSTYTMIRSRTGRVDIDWFYSDNQVTNRPSVIWNSSTADNNYRPE